VKTALILTVGTTAEPLKKAIEEVRAACPADAELSVLLLYGRPFEGQKPDPFEVASEVLEHARAAGIRARPWEIPDPEDLDRCLERVREALREVSSCERVVANYTGGTKAMTAALVHAALTENLAGELHLHYVGGAVRDPHGRVVREAMTLRSAPKTAVRRRLEQALVALRGHRYELAVQLADPLPEVGRPGFFKRAAGVLQAWDGFAYEQAEQGLRAAAQQAQALEDDELLGGLARTLIRLRRVAWDVVKTLQALRALEQGGAEPGPVEGMALLCADVLENGARCLAREQFNEAVLRGYRALEVAVQGALLAAGCNPWRPAWERLGEEAREAVQRELGRLPSELALHAGLIAWRALTGSRLSEDEEKRLRDLQHTRNHSMLEHGYRACGEEYARRCLDVAGTLAARVLGRELADLRAQLRLEA